MGFTRKEALEALDALRADGSLRRVRRRIRDALRDAAGRTPREEEDQRLDTLQAEIWRRHWREEEEELVKRLLRFSLWAHSHYGVVVEVKTPFGAVYDAKIQSEMESVYAGRRRGGRARKLIGDLQAKVNDLVSRNPNANARELWMLIPTEQHV